MELYTLDGLLRRSELIEGYESYIWTERYAEVGELQVKIPSTLQNRRLLKSGTYVGLSESNRVMQIETVADVKDDSGSDRLDITGKEISSVFYNRISKVGTGGSKPNTWTYTAKASNTIRALFDFACRNGIADLNDRLPLLETGSLYPAGNLAEDTTEYTIERDITSLYVAIKEIADVWDLGFRLYKGMDTGKLYFDVYKGNDRTSSQTVFPAVIFSQELDTLQNVSSLNSISNSKNVAEVRNDRMALKVFAEGYDDSVSGFERRVLLVKDTINTGTAVQTDAQRKAMLDSMLQQGKEALAKSRTVNAFDGEITQSSPYKYTRDYELGDLLEMRSKEGTNKMMVTEQIFAADTTGEKAYPTLSVKSFIEAGTWLSWENTQNWENSPGTWSVL